MKKHSRLALGGVALATALVASGCASGGTTPTASPEPTADASPVAAAAQAIVDQAMQPITDFIAPGPAFDASGITGGTVYYIVPDTGAAIFSFFQGYLEEALAPANLDIAVCGTQGTSPEGIANCLNQALDAKATAVIAAATPYVMSPTAFDAITAAGIPIVHTLIQPAGEGDPTKIAYIAPDQLLLSSWNANWIIADSNGEANVLVGQDTDNPVLTQISELGAIATFAADCPDCTVKAYGSSLAFADKIPTDISTALVADPGVGYIQAPFDAHMNPTVQGIQAAGRTDVKVSSTDASFAVMQLLSQGQYVGSASGFSLKAFGWYAADELLRMLAGESSIVEPNFPYMRLFTAANVGELTVTEAAWADGSWYGATNIEQDFLTLWGLK